MNDEVFIAMAKALNFIEVRRAVVGLPTSICGISCLIDWLSGVRALARCSQSLAVA